MTPGAGAAAGAIVIGTGRMGTALAAWLRRIRVRVHPVARPGMDALRAGWGRRRPGTLFLAVPDDALPTIAERLATWGRWRGWRVIHTSGARPAAVLEPLRREGAAVASMHPMMTFSGGKVSPAGLVFSLEGDPAAVAAAARLVKAWRGTVLHLSTEAKLAYHLAATLVGPGAVVSLGAAEAVLRAAGLRPREWAAARAGLVQLLVATARNLEMKSTAAAFTGPWARGDVGTIRLHRGHLKDKRILKLYDALRLARIELPNGA